MKIYDKLFKLSFLFYIIIIYKISYVTFTFFIFSVLYQLAYIIYFRKKNNLKLSKVIGKYFIYIANCISIYIILDYANMFVFGYTPVGILGDSADITYYGLEAWENNSWANLIYIPWLGINAILISFDYVINNTK